MYYRSIADLNADIRRWMPELLPRHFDVVGGYSRDGLLAANLLSLHMNLPMADVEGLCQGRLLSWGSRYKARPPDLQRQMNVLVLDDSTGCRITDGEGTRENNGRKSPAPVLFWSCVYTTVPGTKVLDIWHSILDGSRAFEWNLMHHGVLTNRVSI